MKNNVFQLSHGLKKHSLKYTYLRKRFFAAATFEGI